MSWPYINLVEAAAMFAKRAHGGQLRKYTGEPYFVHLEEVADLVWSFGVRDEVVAAAYLHDTLEDTDVTEAQLELSFGAEIAGMVKDLTDLAAGAKDSEGNILNREKRKELDRARLANASAEVQTIKLADLISNTGTIVEHDPDFAKVYLGEKRKLLAVMNKGNPELFRIAQEQSTCHLPGTD